MLDEWLKKTDKKYELKDSAYLEELNTFIHYFLNILWENPKIVVQILINSDILDIKNNLASFFMNNFYENILSESNIEDNIILILTLMLKNEVNNLNSSSDYDNFLGSNSAVKFLLNELRKKNDVKNFFKNILSEIIKSLESIHSDEIINIEVNEIQKEINSKIKNTNNLNNNFNGLNKEKKNDIFRYNKSQFHPETKNWKIKVGNDKFIGKYLKMLSKDELKSKLDEYKNNKNMTEYINIQLNKCKDHEDIFSNKNFFENMYSFKYSGTVFGSYENNFMKITEMLDNIINNLMQHISLLPFSIKCLCKIISELLSKKFPNITTTKKNIFISKFFFNVIFLPIFKNPTLESLINEFIISKNSIKNFHTISNIIEHLISGNFYTNKFYLPFNNYFLEKMPIIYNLFEKLSNTTLPHFIEHLINEDLEENYKYNYFDINSDEILFHKCICYNLDIIITLLKNINKYKDKIFANINNKDLEKTINKLNSHSNFKLIEKLNNHNEYETIKELKNSNTKKLEYIEVKNRKKLYFFLDSELIFNDKYKNLFTMKKNTFIYENEELKSAKNEEEILKNDVIRVKNYFSYLLCNYRKIKKTDFDHLKIFNTENIIKELKILMNSSNYLIDNTIPLNWYSDALLDYIKKIPDFYRDNDYEKLLLELENDINTSIKQLNFEVLVVYNDKMSIMKRHKFIYEETKNLILDIKQSEKAKQIIENELIPVEIEFEYSDSNKIFKISKLKSTKLTSVDDIDYEENNNYKVICPTIEAFQNYFPNISKFEIINLNSFDIMKQLKLPGQLLEYFKLVKISLDKALNINNSHEIENISNIIYDYIMNKLYIKIFPTMPLKKDLQIIQNCAILSWIEPKHIIKGKINYVYDAFLPDIMNYIKLIEIEKSPRKKQINLCKVFKSIANLVKFNGDNSIPSIDDNLNILSYIIIKSKPFQIYANSKYIELFLGDKMHQLEGNQLLQLLSVCEICEKLGYKDLYNIDKDEFEKKCNQSRAFIDKNI